MMAAFSYGVLKVAEAFGLWERTTHLPTSCPVLHRACLLDQLQQVVYIGVFLDPRRQFWPRALCGGYYV